MKKRLNYYWRLLLVAVLGRHIRCKKTGKSLGKMFTYIDSNGCVVVMGIQRQTVYVDFETANSIGFSLVHADVFNENSPHHHHTS